jgi:hypothetical protein
MTPLQYAASSSYRADWPAKGKKAVGPERRPALVAPKISWAPLIKKGRLGSHGRRSDGKAAERRATEAERRVTQQDKKIPNRWPSARCRLP